jgi:hypothetical protein
MDIAIVRVIRQTCKWGESGRGFMRVVVSAMRISRLPAILTWSYFRLYFAWRET